MKFLMPEFGFRELPFAGETFTCDELHLLRQDGTSSTDNMKFFDLFLAPLLPVLVLLHLFVAPYTKVEESFNLQAAHDILAYHAPVRDIGSRLRATYDHFEFPGAVPRTFVGAVILAGVSTPVLSLVGWQHGQFVVRAILGLFNAAALLRYKDGVDRAFGTQAGRWFVLLLASQFHVIYYASRTLPNMFAFGLCTLAMREFLPMPPSKTGEVPTAKRQRLGIYLTVLAGVMFRAELAILLTTQLLYLFVQQRISLQTIIPAGLCSALFALAISVPIDSYFWQRIIWPELAGFVYNAIQGKSAGWGTSPFHTYITSFLPKLLLNPLITSLLIPLAFFYPSTRYSAASLVVPSLAFIAIYSLQPHKEARFIIYVVPPLTACAALGASYIFTRRFRTIPNGLLSLLLVISIIGSFAVSLVFLGISSLNYPGGEALFRLHEQVARDQPAVGRVNVHMDVLACMTGVSRFQQAFPSPPLPYRLSWLLHPFLPTSTSASHHASSLVTVYDYDKTEAPAALLDPEFWTRFDYVLTERPETVMGKWEVVGTVFGYGGMEVLRPGQQSRSGVEEEIRILEDLGGKGQDENGHSIVGTERERERDERDVRKEASSTTAGILDEVGNLGVYDTLREWIRKHVTRGWWVGPRMEAKIRILKRAE